MSVKNSDLLDREKLKNLYLEGLLEVEELIKRKDITDEHRKVIISIAPFAIHYLSPELTEGFDELACAAVWKGEGAILNIKPEFLTKALLRSIFLKDSRSLSLMREIPDGVGVKLLDRELCSIAVATNIRLAELDAFFPIDDELLSDEAFKRGVLKMPHHTHILEDRKKMHLLDELVRDGSWPQDSEIGTKPIFVKCAVRSYLAERNFLVDEMTEGREHVTSTLDWLRSNLKSYPVAEVVGEMIKDQIGHEELVKLYTLEELKPFFKKHRRLKHLFLSQDFEI